MKVLYHRLIVVMCLATVSVAVSAQLPDNVDTIADCVGAPQPSHFDMTEAWRSTIRVNNYVTPVVGDVDGDRRAEIFAVTSVHSSVDNENYYLFDRIAVFRGNDRNNPVFINTVRGRNINVSSLALAKVEVNSVDRYLIYMIGLDDGHIYAYDAASASSTPVWISTTTAYPNYNNNYEEHIYATSLNIADFNCDGHPEIYCGSRIFDAATGVFLCEIPGGHCTGSSTYNNFPMFTSVTQQLTVAANVLGDDRLELCAGLNVYNVNIHSRTNSSLNSVTVAATFTYTLLSPLWLRDGKTIVADIDQDGQLDVVTSDINGSRLQIIVWNPRTQSLIAHGGIPWVQPQNYPFVSVPLVGNIDSNPDVEIVQVTYDKITAYRLNRGTNMLDIVYTTQVVDPSGGTGITLFDFNQDGIMELVYRDEENLRIMNANPHTADFDDRSVFPAYAGTGFEYPLVADVDNDYQAEIIAVGGNNNNYIERREGFLRIYKSDGAAWAPARRVWNQYAYNAVNINENLSIPRRQFNPATFFAGNDRVLGTADDIQPFNAFLQQHTTLDRYGEPFRALPEIRDTISTFFCTGHHYLFYGTSLSVAGTYEHTVIVPNGCDSIITLILTEHPNISYSYKDTSYACEKYVFGSDSLHTSGIYRDTLVARNGCDSIVELDLTVLPSSFADSITICADRLPIAVYDTVFGTNATSGVYLVKHRCARIDLKLNIIPNIDASPPILPDEICADDRHFSIKFTKTKSNAKLPTHYKIAFDGKALQQGFADDSGRLGSASDITVDIPDPIEPDYYQCHIELYDTAATCKTLHYDLVLPVLYSARILTQMWNDVIAVLNERYNGGYRFADYAWYKNNIVIEGEKRSFIYIRHGQLDFGQQYRAELTRSDNGVRIKTCSIIPQYHNDITQYPTVVGSRQRFAVVSTRSLTLEIQTVAGTIVSTHKIAEGSTEIDAPEARGIYIIVMYDNLRRVDSGKIIVK